MNHYHQLIEIQKRYQDRGFSVLGFPCNQFFRQENGSCLQIKDFLAENGVNFPVFDKVNVNGRNASDLFKYLRMHSRLHSTRIGWNFGKFLVGRDGHVGTYYGPRTEPNRMIGDIEKML